MLDEFDIPNTPSPSSGRDSSGILRTKIQLGRKPSVIMPFYLMKPDLPPAAPITGSVNLLSYYGLDHAWSKFCGSKKMKEELSSFLPNLPGNIDIPAHMDGSSLKALVEKPPITGKEIHPLSNTALIGFKLQPGSIPEHLKPAGYGSLTEKKRHKRKHERVADEDRGNVDDDAAATAPTSSMTSQDMERRAKRIKKEEEKEGKRKKKKKDKKRKRAAAAATAGLSSDENPSSVPASGPAPASGLASGPAPASGPTPATPLSHSLSSATDFLSF